MVNEIQNHLHMIIATIPVIAHFALLIGFSVWGFIDDSTNAYAKWVWGKLTKTTFEAWEVGDTFLLYAISMGCALLYLVANVFLLKIEPLAPYMVFGFIAMMLIGRGLRRAHKVLTEHINDKKSHN
jgi:hypothetical protein